MLSKDKKKYTALALACARGNVSIGQLLLLTIKERHGDKEVSNILNCQTLEGETPLYFAAKAKSLDLVKLLLKYDDTAVNIADKSGKTPLHHVARDGKLDIVKLLVDGSDLLAEDDDGKTSFSLAASGGHREVMKYILDCLKKKGDSEKVSLLVNKGTNGGLTPLLLAAKSNRLEEVEVRSSIAFFYF